MANFDPIVADIEEYDSRYDKAVWTYIKARDVWEVAVRFARADILARGRYWIKRADIPSKESDVGADAIAELEHALSVFFVASQGRGHVCKVEHCMRADGSDYFFAYLDDYADTYINFDEEGEFARTPERRAFELVFVYNREYGTLEMFARGGKKVNEHPVLTRKDFMGAFEICFYGWRLGAGHQFLGPNNATDLWAIKKVNPQSMIHLTEKPVELAVRAIQYSSKPGENVLELFGGSGSTLIACEQTGRQCFAMELDELYCDVIVKCWEEFAGRKAERMTVLEETQ